MTRNESRRTSLRILLPIIALALPGCVGIPDSGCFTEGLTLCAGQCVDTASDTTNCGGCGITCASGEDCTLGSCGTESRSTVVQPEGCQDECAAVGVRRCGKPGDDGVLLCDDFDGDGCLEWSPPSPCAEGQICAAGSCDDACVGDCGASDEATDEGLGADAPECIEPNEDCVNFDDCCDDDGQGYHCCPVFHFCVPNFWE